MLQLKILRECSKKDLNRALKSNKEYILFDVNIFNAGVVCIVKCTNIYTNPAKKEDYNGYDFIISNDDFIKNIIKDELCKK